MTLPVKADYTAYQGYATYDQIAAIKKIEEAGVKITEDKLREILSGLPVGPSNVIPTPGASDNLATKILNLAKKGKIEEASRAELKALGVRDDQIKALLAATNLDTSAKIKKFLKSTNRIIPIKDKELSSDKSVSQKSNGLLYNIFLIFCGVLLVSAIGGGAYMMTRKTSETGL